MRKAYGGYGAFLLDAERKGHLKKALREFSVLIYCTPYMLWQVGSVETERGHT